MKVVLLDTGRGRNVASVDLWRTQLELEEGDELALISWNHPKLALPVVDQLVFGPTLQWNRPEPARPNVTLPLRRAGRYRSSAADLPRTDPRRLATSLAVRAAEEGPAPPLAQPLGRPEHAVGAAERRRVEQQLDFALVAWPARDEVDDAEVALHPIGPERRPDPSRRCHR